MQRGRHCTEGVESGNLWDIGDRGAIMLFRILPGVEDWSMEEADQACAEQSRATV